MENGGEAAKWRFGAVNPALQAAGRHNLRSLVHDLYDRLDKNDPRPVVPLGHGDPSAFACFRTAAAAEESVVAAAMSGKHNSYARAAGVDEARSAVAAHLSRELPYEVTAGDVVITAGCNHAIEVMMAVLAAPGANVLLPRPGYPMYQSRASLCGLEFRNFDLLPAKGWEVDLDGVEAIADENTVAMVIVNPNNPCGCVYSYDHLAEIIESVIGYRAISADPATFIQGALPQIIANTDKAFFENAMNVLSEAAEICYQKLKEIECVTCPHKPEGSMFVMVKLDLSCLDGIHDDVDFCTKVAREESVVICPGSGLGMKDWIRITFAVDPPLLEDGLERIKSFCKRHSKPRR